MYDELVKELRGEYGYDTRKYIRVMKAAADAIEELVRKEKYHVFLWNTIQPNEMEQYLAMYRAHNDPRCIATDGGKTDER